MKLLIPTLILTVSCGMEVNQPNIEVDTDKKKAEVTEEPAAAAEQAEVTEQEQTADAAQNVSVTTTTTTTTTVEVGSEEVEPVKPKFVCPTGKLCKGSSMDDVLALFGEPDLIRPDSWEGTVWVYKEVRGLETICDDNQFYPDVECEVVFHATEEILVNQRYVKTVHLDIKTFK